MLDKIAELQTKTVKNTLALMLKGGPGSGNHGHSGIPGQVGGSQSSGAAFEQAASSGKITKSTELGGGVCNSKIVEYENGDAGVFKSLMDPNAIAHDGNSEVAAYRLNNLLGFDIVPPTVYAEAEGKIGSSQKFIDGLKTGYELEPGNLKLDSVTPEIKEQVLALDYIMGNTDRHSGNWGVDPSGKVWAIDFGNSKWRDGNSGIGKWVVNNNSMITDRELQGYKIYGKYEFSSDMVDRLKSVSRENFNKEMGYINQDGNVNLDTGWNNMQLLIENGGIKW